MMSPRIKGDICFINDSSLKENRDMCVSYLNGIIKYA